MKVFEDQGISGAKGRDQRPAFDALLKAAVRREIDMIAVWSSDRLGRSLSHLVEVLQTIRDTGIGLYIHTQAVDTTTPAGRALFGMLGVFAEFEREMIVARVNAGLARTKERARARRPVHQQGRQGAHAARPAGREARADRGCSSRARQGHRHRQDGPPDRARHGHRAQAQAGDGGGLIAHRTLCATAGARKAALRARGQEGISHHRCVAGGSAAAPTAGLLLIPAVPTCWPARQGSARNCPTLAANRRPTTDRLSSGQSL